MASDSSRIMVVGDLHGQVGQIEAIGREAARHHLTTIVQVGDFGLWPGKEVSWINDVEATMAANGVDLLVWIDGNHENHGMTKWLAERRRDGDGLVTMRGQDGGPLIRYAPRGSRWSWSGVRFGALGGAFSVDHSMRQAGKTWWPGAGPGGEEPSQDEADKLIAGGPLDVLLTHDAPTMVELAAISPRAASRFLPESDERRSREVRRVLQTLVDATHPRLVVHGHHHARASHDLETRDGHGVIVESLGEGGMGHRAWGVLTLPNLDFADGIETYRRANLSG